MKSTEIGIQGILKNHIVKDTNPFFPYLTRQSFVTPGTLALFHCGSPTLTCDPVFSNIHDNISNAERHAFQNSVTIQSA